MLDAAFEALKTFDWGSDLATLVPIEDAAVAAYDKPERIKDLETRLIGALNGALTRDAKDYVCRKLATVGTAASVPTLATLLINPDSSHMARFALEQIPSDDASRALRDALPKVSGTVKVGIISSLGARRDSAAVKPLGQLLTDSDPAVARAASLALGAIGNSESVAVLQQALTSASANRSSLVDALFSCAESLLKGNKRSDARSIYKTLASDSQPRLVRLAATRGLLASANDQA